MVRIPPCTQRTLGKGTIKFAHTPLAGLKRTIFHLASICLFSLLTACATLETHYFKIHFIDDQTGRGVPLVELKTTNAVRYVSDSAGWVAISPRDLNSKALYFSVHSHGYELKRQLNGFHGISVQPVAGGSKVVALQRINIAERLYRVTGEGIYHDSLLLDIAPPTSPPEQLPGGVFGQDSVVNAIYEGQLYWFWGDTRRADGPLGNFEVSGAVSKIPRAGEDIAADGIQLNYFVDKKGFVRPMCPIEGAGPVWISGLMVFDEDGQELMLTHYSRVKDVETRVEQGIAAWNDEGDIFEKRVEFPLDTPLYPRGLPLKLDHGGQTWFYFGRVFPNVRVRATQRDILDPKRYQAFTCLTPGSRWQNEAPPLERDESGRLVCSWKRDTDLITESRWQTLIKKRLVRPDEKRWQLIDVETGDQIIPHSGSVTWNQHRKRWILIFGQFYGHSLLGEVWYAEALNPMGPWSFARKIVTHNRYSFYNVKQHPYFASGPYLYFEGTYSTTFSGSNQTTARYEYNQIMYRLNLDDSRLPRMTGPNPPTKRGSLIMKAD